MSRWVEFIGGPEDGREIKLDDKALKSSIMVAAPSAWSADEDELELHFVEYLRRGSRLSEPDKVLYIVKEML